MTNAAIKEAFGALRPGAELRSLEEAARSRSEADWIVGMNATRAATIRLRSSFDGAVSLGRVQTPTLAILARREEEIRAFKPEPYWVVDARFDAVEEPPARATRGASTPARTRAWRRAEEARAIVAACAGQVGEITKLEKRERKERPPLLYDLTSLQREANTRFGFSARRTLGGRAAALRGAQGAHLSAHELALPDPRHGRRDQADRRARRRARGVRAPRPTYVIGLDVLPLGRVVNDAKVTDHHAIIPTRAERHPVDKMDADDLRIYDLVVRRFLAVFHPEAVFENTRVETTVADARVPHPRQGAAGRRAGAACTARLRTSDADGATTTTRAPSSSCRGWSRARPPRCARSTRERKETKPPRRYTDGSLLGAMETAGKLVDDEELREAMKDSGIGTPATRAAIIERLLQVGYIERDGRALVVTEKGLNVIRLLGEHALTSPGADRRMGAPAGEDRDRRGLAQGVHGRHRQVRRGDRRRARRRSSRTCGSRAPTSGPCPVCGHDIVENRKGYSCWSREDPGCGFVIWKSKAGKQLPIAIARELIKTGRTERPVTGFKGRSGQELPRPPRADADRGGPLAGRVRRAVGEGGREAARGRGDRGRRSPRRPAPPTEALGRRVVA